MEHSGWLRDTLVFLAAAVILLPVVQRLKSTSILGFLTVGLVIGPYGLALIRDSEDIHNLAELGVVFLLFAIGLELSLSRIRLLALYVFGLGGLQVCVTAFVNDGLLFWSGLPLQAALIIGGALALSSTAFVTEMLLERNELMSRHGRFCLAVLLAQDIAVIPMLVFLGLLKNSGGHMAEAFLTAGASGVLAVFAIIVVGRFVLRPVYQTIARTNNPDLFVAATLLMVLGSGWTLVQGGLSMAMGAFLCGVLLAESEFRHQIEADIRPFKGLLLGLFFATVGMSLDIGLIIAHSLEIAWYVLILIGLKSGILCFLSRIFGLDWRESLRVGLLLSQGGEFAFVILGSAQLGGLIDVETAQLAMAVVGLSMVLTPLLDWVGRMLPSTTSALIPPEAASDKSDFVLIAGFGRVGQTVAKSLSEVGVPYLAVDNNTVQVEACRNLGLSIYFGDAAKPGVLERAGAGRARAVVLALDREKDSNAAVASLRNSGIDVPIVARSRDLAHGRMLEWHGANAVVPDTVEASLRLGEVVLGLLEVPDAEAREALNRLRSDDYALLEKLVRSAAKPD
jgi:monovalent cation:H+ antiporter-2, CPA2 family